MSTLPIFVPTSFEREAMNRAKLKRATRRVPDILAGPAAAACAPTEHQQPQEIKGTHFVVRDVINQLKGAQDVLQFPVVNLHAACVAILDSMQHASAAEHVGTSASVAIAGAVQAVVSSLVDIAATDDSGAPAGSPVVDVASLMRAVSSPACAWMDALKAPVIGLTRDGCSLPAMELPLRAVLMSMLEAGLPSPASPAEEPGEKPAGARARRGKGKKPKRKRGAKLAPVPSALAAVPGALGKGLRQQWRARVCPVVAGEGHPLYDSSVWAQKLQLPVPRGSAACLAAESELAGMHSGILMPHARTDVGEMLNDWLVALPRAPADDTSHAALAEALSPLHALYEVAAVLRAVPCVWPEALFARSFTVLWQHVLGYARASEQVPIAVVSTAGAAASGDSAEAADAQAAEESHQGAAGVDEVSAHDSMMPAVLAMYAPADLLGAISPQDITVLAFAAQPGYELTGAATYLLCSVARVLASVLLCAAADHYQPARRVDFAGDVHDASSQAPSRVGPSFASDVGSDGYGDDFSECGPGSDATPVSPVPRPSAQPEAPGSPANTYASDFEATTAPRTPGPLPAGPVQLPQRHAPAATMDELGGGPARRGDVGSPTPSKHSRGTAESAQRAGNTTLTERDVHAVLDWAMGAPCLPERARNLLRRGEVEQFCIAVADSCGERGAEAEDAMGDASALATSPGMLSAVWQAMSQALLEAVGLGDSRASITLTIRSGVPGHELQRRTMVRLGKGITFERLVNPVLRAWLLAAHEVVPVWRRTGRMLLSCDTPRGVGMGHWGHEEIVIVPLLWVSRHPLAAASAVRCSTCLSGQHLDLTQLWPGMADIASGALATMAAWSLVRNALTVTPQLVDHMYLQESARRAARAAAAEEQRKFLQRDLPQHPGGLEPVLSPGLDAPSAASSRPGAAAGKPPTRLRSESGCVPGFKSQVGLGHAYPDFKSNFAASTVRDGLDKQAAVDASVSAHGAPSQDASAAGNSVADEFALMVLRRALSDWWAQVAAWAAVQAADAAAWAAYVEDTEDWSLRGAATVEGSVAANVALLNEYDERREEPGSERATSPPPSMLARHGTMRQERSVESMLPSSEQRLLAMAEWTQLQEVHSKATAQALRAFLPPEALIQTTEPLLAMSAMRRSMGYDATLMDISTPRLPTLQVKLPAEDVKYNQAPRDALVAAATASGRDVLWPARNHGAAAPAAGAKQSNASAGMAAVDKAVLDGVARGKDLIARAVRAVRVAQQTSAPARLAVVGQRYSGSAAARAWIAAQQACEQADALLRALRTHCKDAADRALGIVKHRSAVLRRADPGQGLAGVASARPGTAPAASDAAGAAGGPASKKPGKGRPGGRAKASALDSGQPAETAPAASQTRARAAATKRMALSSRARQREAVAAALAAAEQQRQADEAAAVRQRQASTRARKFDSIYRAAQSQPTGKELQARTRKFIVSLKPQPARASPHALEHGQPKFSDILPPPAHALVRHVDELAYTARRAEIKTTAKQGPPGPASPHGVIHWLPKMPAMPESAVWRTSSQARATPAKPTDKARAAAGPRKRRVQAAAVAAPEGMPVNAGLEAGAPMEPPAPHEPKHQTGQHQQAASEAAPTADDARAAAAASEHSGSEANYSEDEYEEDEFFAEEA